MSAEATVQLPKIYYLPQLVTDGYTYISEYDLLEIKLDEKDLTQKVENMIGTKLNWGDVICPFSEEESYRNNGKAIFDGNNFVPLDDTLDEYGALPEQFHVIDNGLPPNAFVESIGHNVIVHVNMKEAIDGEPKWGSSYYNEGEDEDTKLVLTIPLKHGFWFECNYASYVFEELNLDTKEKILERVMNSTTFQYISEKAITDIDDDDI